MNFWQGITSTFIGAAFAFLFALVLYLYQKKASEGYYLSFVIVYITSQISQLYSFKKNIIESRKIELKKLETQIKQIKPDDTATLTIHEISKFISNPRHSTNVVDLEKLNFIAHYDPNLFSLIKASLDADHGVEEIIQGCNSQIQHVRENYNLNDIWTLISFNWNLVDQIDFAITVLEKSQAQLIAFAKHEFEYYTKISDVDLVQEYEQYRPNIQNSWTEFKYTYPARGIKKRVKNLWGRLLSCW